MGIHLTSASDREVLASLCKGAKCAVDVGTFLGSTAQVILANMDREGKLYTIDTFQGSTGGASTKAVGQLEQIRSTLGLLSHYDDRATVIVGRSNIGALFAEGSVDFVWLDGAHDYRSVLEDIHTWLPCIALDGIICGHDYEMPSSACAPSCLKEHIHLDYCDEHGCHPGVIKAVDEMLGPVQHKERVWWKRV